jgi:hypothetical protein
MHDRIRSELVEEWRQVCVDDVEAPVAAEPTRCGLRRTTHTKDDVTCRGGVLPDLASDKSSATGHKEPHCEDAKNE